MYIVTVIVITAKFAGRRRGPATSCDVSIFSVAAPGMTRMNVSK